MAEGMEELTRAVGRIEGTLASIDARLARGEAKFDLLDSRMRAVEKKSAVWGMISGAVGALLTALGIGFLKSKLGG